MTFIFFLVFIFQFGACRSNIYVHIYILYDDEDGGGRGGVKNLFTRYLKAPRPKEKNGKKL